jgi:hypothetical protein
VYNPRLKSVKASVTFQFEASEGGATLRQCRIQHPKSEKSPEKSAGSLFGL